MARGVFIVSEQYKEKLDIIKQIESFVKNNNFKIKHNKNEFYDLIVYEEESFALEFNISNKLEFKEDEFEKDNKKFYISILISYYSGNLPYVNQFIKYFLTLNPEMLVDDNDDSNRKFYSIDQINKKEVPQWLLE